jgi:hypothetical protein
MPSPSHTYIIHYDLFKRLPIYIKTAIKHNGNKNSPLVIAINFRFDSHALFQIQATIAHHIQTTPQPHAMASLQRVNLGRNRE